MTTHPTSNRLIALSALFALVLTACASTSTTIAADRSFEVLPIEAPTAGAAAPAGNSGHEYGATLDEWTEVEQETQAATSNEPAENQNVPTAGYDVIEWKDLIPPGFSGEEVVARFEARLDAVEYGSPEADALYEELRNEYDPEAINTGLAGQQIRLAGFVAPLTYEDDIVTEFLLVPTFGACIHVPPPPPNQTVMVTVDKADGLTLEESWGAVWVEGTITLDATTTDLAAASYTISNATSGAYSDV